MGKGHFDVSAGGLDGVAATLHRAGGHVENGAAPPPAPEAGAISGPIAAAMAVLIGSVGGVARGLTVAGEAVRDSRSVYQDIDHQTGTVFNGMLQAP